MPVPEHGLQFSEHGLRAMHNLILSSWQPYGIVSIIYRELRSREWNELLISTTLTGFSLTCVWLPQTTCFLFHNGYLFKNRESGILLLKTLKHVLNVDSCLMELANELVMPENWSHPRVPLLLHPCRSLRPFSSLSWTALIHPLFPTATPTVVSWVLIFPLLLRQLQIISRGKAHPFESILNNCHQKDLSTSTTWWYHFLA